MILQGMLVIETPLTPFNPTLRFTPVKPYLKITIITAKITKMPIMHPIMVPATVDSSFVVCEGALPIFRDLLFRHMI